MYNGILERMYVLFNSIIVSLLRTCVQLLYKYFTTLSGRPGANPDDDLINKKKKNKKILNTPLYNTNRMRVSSWNQIFLLTDKNSILTCYSCVYFMEVI